MAKKRIALEPFIEHPNGNGSKVRRCQAISKRSGQQCKRVAVSGYDVCSVHGAGTKKRVEEGERKAAGRPKLINFYSETGIRNVQQMIASANAEAAELPDLAMELRITRAALAATLTYQEDMLRVEQEIAEWRETAIVDPQTSMQIARILLRLHSYNIDLQEMVIRVAKVVQTIKNIENRTAESKALEMLAKGMDIMRAVMMQNFPHSDYERIYEEFKLRVLGDKVVN
jgi:hypothetical protein